MRSIRTEARRRRALATPLLLATLHGAPVAAQDANIILPVAEIEARLLHQPFRVLDWRGSRRPDDRTHRATLAFEDSVVLFTKWASAPANGGAFNNEPRYEVAAYELQKLFLDEAEYVVPPTVLRAFPLDFVRTRLPDARPTFKDAPGSVLVALQYWLSAVTPDDFWNRERARSDSVYARHIGNFNILTYLIHHSDANVGNYLVSTQLENPRVFSVDNGVSFASEASNRGTQWRSLQVELLPGRTLDRLRGITREQLEAKLGILAEYEVREGELVPVPPGENLSRHRGIRKAQARVQIGLTEQEIRGVEQRIRSLLREAGGRKVF